MKRTVSNRKAWKGSYTVEAAFVVSITFLVLASLVILTFYAHDRGVLQALLCEITAAGSNYATGEERAAAVEEAGEQVTASRFLGSRDLSGSASAGENEVTADWSAVYPVPGFAAPYLADGELSVSASWSRNITDPAGTIRKIRGAGELLTGGGD